MLIVLAPAELLQADTARFGTGLPMFLGISFRTFEGYLSL